MKCMIQERSLVDLEGALGVGANFARKEDVQEAAYALFFRRGDSSLQKVYRSSKKHFEVRCTEESCKLKIRSSVQAKSGMWVVKEAELHHSCNVNERTGRQRGVRSDVIQAFVPTTSAVTLGGKRAETIKNLVSSTIGVQLKATQARGIANEGRTDPTATAVNEFKFIEAYIQKLGASDRAGTYKFKKEAGWRGWRCFPVHICCSWRSKGILGSLWARDHCS